MNNLTVHNFNGWDVRVVTIDGEPWFVAVDVCNVLGLGNPREAMTRLDWDEKSTVRISDGGPEANIVSEAGLYTLIIRSNKSVAKPFRKWVTHDVLPSIRKHGMYATPATVEAMLADPDTMIATLQALKQERAARLQAEQQLQIAAPKVEGYDALMSSKDAMPIGEFAKVLGWGQNRMFKWLREEKILMTDPWNIPYQKHIDAGHFKVIEEPWGPDDDKRIYRKSLVTPAGQEYILKRKKEAGL